MFNPEHRMLHRRALVLTVLLMLGMLFLPVGRAGALSAELQLDPSSGPAGTSIRVTPVVKFAGTCAVRWDGHSVGTFPCGPDAASGVLGSTTLTAQGAPGSHTILVCLPSCDGIDSPAWAESASFTVLAVVPELGSLSLDDASQRLKSAGLVLGTVQGPSADPAARVGDQVPPPGAAVEAGTAVNLTLSLPGPAPVTVPDLVGRTREEAAALVTNRRLVLRVASGTGRVQRQDPLPGSQVAAGSVVTVTLEASSNQVLVAVPDVRGRTAGDAEAAVAAAGLVLNATGPAAGTVQAQDPAPGTQVQRGSAVAVTLAVPGSPSTTTPPTAPGGAAGLPVGLALLAVAVVLVALVVRMLRRAPRRRSSEWVHEHVRLTAGASPSQPGDIHIGEAGPEPTHTVGLEPHRDPGSQTLEEVKR
jgi:PASTA domain